MTECSQNIASRLESNRVNIVRNNSNGIFCSIEYTVVGANICAVTKCAADVKSGRVMWVTGRSCELAGTVGEKTHRNIRDIKQTLAYA